jgi:hypothetical protein
VCAFHQDNNGEESGKGQQDDSERNGDGEGGKAR